MWFALFSSWATDSWFPRYDPRKRITAAQALDHEYEICSCLYCVHMRIYIYSSSLMLYVFDNGTFGLNHFQDASNALVPSQPGEKVVNYPTRPVDTTTDFEGTTSLQSSQPGRGIVNGRGIRKAGYKMLHVKGIGDA
ncbi:hypothetical protein CsSME_00006408 [Camellia sinensis var. sinensis]